MATKRALAQQLGVVGGFENPRVDLEQYRTPPDLAAHLIHRADLNGDIADRTIIDLGCGTGMLSLASALRGPRIVVGLDIDDGPLHVARENERKVASSASISWVQAAVEQCPLCPDGPTTVIMNPPFGAQEGNRHADRGFLETTAKIADVSYSIHNAESAQFVESFAVDNGGEVTQAYAAEFDVPHSFDFHEDSRRSLDVEVFRIEWSN